MAVIAAQAFQISLGLAPLDPTGAIGVLQPVLARIVSPEHELCKILFKP